ncbi:hypothetical protein GUITHDRAFT_109088 [Guillardia theta CCMP2712]|uniref:Uncharacterized protein n=1 Tax=Guillardia theta (strain CCMP2712) TaxID=905079 RepID=L1JAC7_GUITC|nr:hypothetical protein GUITHDRAFT_109088 [Guillardia theta CCMP2712]EKX45045.1 hypothetical protein GUITHDRAFT_109088 [Guillardia theta CCMP2712]|eukprot:XP_005832025.1 hypothetical protein GUITHDRAFT_109088 [Guillardia theta CCMP2712]
MEVDPCLHLEDSIPIVNFSQVEQEAGGQEAASDGDDFIFQRETHRLDDPFSPTTHYLEAENYERIYNLSWDEGWPKMLEDESEIPPGVFRFLGRTKNGGWRNPGKHTHLTGVQVKAPGSWFEELGQNGQMIRIRGPAFMALDHVFPWRDKQFELLDTDDVPSRKGVRVLQPAIGVRVPDLLEWRERPICDWMAWNEGWFVVDVGRGRRVRPTHYCMRNGGGVLSSPGAWIVEGSCSRKGPWSAVDMRGFDFDIETVSFEEKYFERAKSRQYVFPKDNEKGGFKEPEDGYIIPKSHCSIVWRTTDIEKDWYRFIRVTQFKAMDCFTKRMFVQGFELYGELKMGCDEIEREEEVNPQELTDEENNLLAEEVEIALKKKVVTWDPKDLIDRERQKALEERFERITEEALKAGQRQQVDISPQDEEEVQGKDNELGQMSASEILYVVWESEDFQRAVQDVIHWLKGCKDSVSTVRSWLRTASSHTTQNVDKTCKLLDKLLQASAITASQLSEAVSDPETVDIISSDNPHLLKSLNSMLVAHSMPTITSPEDDEGGGAGDDLEEEMELLRQLRLSRSKGRTQEQQQQQGWEEEEERGEEEEKDGEDNDLEREEQPDGEDEQEWQEEEEEEEEWREQGERQFARGKEGKKAESSELERTSSTEPSDDTSTVGGEGS